MHKFRIAVAVALFLVFSSICSSPQTSAVQANRNTSVAPTPAPIAKKAPVPVKPARRAGEVARPSARRELQPEWARSDETVFDLARSNEEKARALFEQAKTLISQRKPSEAMTLLRDAEKLEPNRFEIIATLGVAHALLRQYDEAVIAFERAIKLQPKEAPLYANLCRALSESGRRSQAVEQCKKAIELDPANLRFKSQLAEIHLLDDRSAEALQLLEGIFARSQSDIVYLGTLADAHYMHGDYAKAAELYEQIAAKWPNVSKTYLRLAGVYDYLDRGSLAIQAARKFRDLESKLFISHFNLGMTLKGFGFFEEAIEPLSAAKSMQPDVGDIYLALGDCYEILGDKENALANLKFAFEHLPPDGELAHKLGSALIDYGDRDGAVKPLEQALQLSPGHAGIMFGLGLAYLEVGEDDKGVELIEKAQQISPLPPGMTVDLSGVKTKKQWIGRLDEVRALVEKNPNDVKARGTLGYIYTLKRMYPEAEQQYLEMIKRAPEQKYLNGMGVFYYDRGQFEKAVEFYKKAIEVQPHHVTFISLAFAYIRLGRTDEAIAALTRSIELDASKMHSRIMLGDLFLKKNLRQDALKEYLAAYNISPFDAAPNIKLVWLYIRMGNKEGAFKHYQILKAAYPERVENVELSLRAHFGRLP